MVFRLLRDEEVQLRRNGQFERAVFLQGLIDGFEHDVSFAMRMAISSSNMSKDYMYSLLAKIERAVHEMEVRP